MYSSSVYRLSAVMTQWRPTIEGSSVEGGDPVSPPAEQPLVAATPDGNLTVHEVESHGSESIPEFRYGAMRKAKDVFSPATLRQGGDDKRLRVDEDSAVPLPPFPSGDKLHGNLGEADAKSSVSSATTSSTRARRRAELERQKRELEEKIYELERQSSSQAASIREDFCETIDDDSVVDLTSYASCPVQQAADQAEVVDLTSRGSCLEQPVVGIPPRAQRTSDERPDELLHEPVIDEEGENDNDPTHWRGSEDGSYLYSRPPSVEGRDLSPSEEFNLESQLEKVIGDDDLLIQDPSGNPFVGYSTDDLLSISELMMAMSFLMESVRADPRGPSRQ